MLIAEIVKKTMNAAGGLQFEVEEWRQLVEQLKDNPLFTMNTPISRYSIFDRPILFGWTEMVQILLDAGADPDFPSEHRWPISTAAYANKVEIVRLFIKRGGKRIICCHERRSPRTCFGAHCSRRRY